MLIFTLKKLPPEHFAASKTVMKTAILALLLCLVSAAPAFAELRGDINIDGCVDETDLFIAQSNYGLEAQAVSDGDANLDGFVNERDIVLIQENMGMCIHFALPG